MLDELSHYIKHNIKTTGIPSLVINIRFERYKIEFNLPPPSCGVSSSKTKLRLILRCINSSQCNMSKHQSLSPPKESTLSAKGGEHLDTRDPISAERSYLHSPRERSGLLATIQADSHDKKQQRNENNEINDIERVLLPTYNKSSSNNIFIFLSVCFMIRLFIDAGSSSFFSRRTPTGNIVLQKQSYMHMNEKDNYDDDDGRPKVAWLMSFPNSGTTYTNYLVQAVSGYNSASNYGNDEGTGTNTPIWKEELPNGPFYSKIGDDKNLTIPPTGFVLTKTHCGSYCFWECDKSIEYISTPTRFSQNCGRTSYVPKDDTSIKQILQRGQYSASLPKRAVHLIRDPFSNVVSRFHHTMKKFIRQNETTYNYPLDRKGFRTLDAKMKDVYLPYYKDVKDLAKVIPCSSDFIQWTQWHNLACVTTYDLNLPTLIVHYENYTQNFGQTVELLLNFLQLDMKNEAPKFQTGKEYREYYTEEEMTAAREMVEKLALKKTWEYTRHYFL